MTGKQQLFVDYYLGEARCNASAAARLAGYAQPHSQGPRMLENVEIQAAISALTAEIAATADEVLRTLADHMRGLPDECLTEGGDIDVKALKAAGKAHLVKKTKRDKYGGSVELYDAQSAAVQLGKFHRLWGDRFDDLSKLTDEQLAAAIAAETARLERGATTAVEGEPSQ